MFKSSISLKSLFLSIITLNDREERDDILLSQNRVTREDKINNNRDNYDLREVKVVNYRLENNLIKVFKYRYVYYT